MEKTAAINACRPFDMALLTENLLLNLARVPRGQDLSHSISRASNTIPYHSEHHSAHIPSQTQIPRPPQPPPFPSTHLLLLIPTRHLTGFLKNPSLVSNSPASLNTNSYLLATLATINPSSISATFLPTHALGPVLNGMKLSFCGWVRVPSFQRSGLNVWGEKAGLEVGFQMEGRW